ncbi:TetR/AcrR family transcriptional regulator [Streptosporangium sp. CA-135522]|uniref:TetR/AcrR family transcriptional regulator n=1 Tax=Streptosporangium sp. CA-135522 TaxID=3240072 RepID=UPI003D91FE26
MSTPAAPGDQRRRADAVRNRQLALEAAKTLLAQRDATITVEAIARQAGLGAATVVRAFGNKEALIDAAVTDLLDPLIQRARDALSEPDPERALRCFLLDLIEFQSAHWVMSEQLRGLEVPSTTVQRAALRQAVLDMVSRARGAGAIRTDIDPAVATVMLGEVTYAIARSDEASRRLAEGFVTVVLDGLRPQS